MVTRGTRVKFLPRSRLECRDRAAISLRSCRDLRRHYHLAEIAEISLRMPRSCRDLAEIVQRFLETLASHRDCRDLAEKAEIGPQYR